jgi:hypothetical protein
MSTAISNRKYNWPRLSAAGLHQDYERNQPACSHPLNRPPIHTRMIPAKGLVRYSTCSVPARTISGMVCFCYPRRRTIGPAPRRYFARATACSQPMPARQINGTLGTGVMKVDGKVVSIHTMERTLPLILRRVRERRHRFRYKRGGGLSSPVQLHRNNRQAHDQKIGRPQLTSDDVKRLSAAQRNNAASQ